MGNRESGIKIMSRLIGLIRPLILPMIVAIVLGVIGFLCAIFITILGALILGLLVNKGGINDMGIIIADTSFLPSIKNAFILIIVMAILRGILHYIEQYSNHYIAFKLLAIIRHKVFMALRALCPAKLEAKDKGNLISIITTDIELLEVFYAHTISPIAIGFITSLIMVIFIGRINIYLGLLAALGYIVIGFVLPLINGKLGASYGMEFRNKFGKLSSLVLDSIYGIDEDIQYNSTKEKEDKINNRSRELGKLQGKLSKNEGLQRGLTNLFILIFSVGMLFLSIYMYKENKIDYLGMITATVAMMSSFGPVVALSNLSNNLNQTLASGQRVLDILSEEPLVKEVTNGEDVAFNGIKIDSMSFSYEDKLVLDNISLEIPKNKIIGIHGASGCGKSTLLKLLMRFWDRSSGEIKISNKDISKINTHALREIESYVTQDTWIFKDSIYNNIAIGRLGANKEDVIEAAKKASIHDFIMSLPNGYDTDIGELGDNLSGGERQRIGIARAFLHDAPFMLLDEPTSNLDSLNEGIILKALDERCHEKTVILVSHRKSSLTIAHDIISLKA